MNVFATSVRMLMALSLLAASVCGSVARAQDLSPTIEKKVQQYAQKLSGWAANPAIVQAVRDANAKGKVEMGNAQWEELNDAHPTVAAFLASPASKQLKQWEADAGINKLFLRDASGSLVAGSAKPLLFNVASRPPFKGALEGKVWSDAKVRPDPSTQVKSVQISAPVMDGGKVIGVLHSAVTVE